jgi:hypothetical protein
MQFRICYSRNWRYESQKLPYTDEKLMLVSGAGLPLAVLWKIRITPGRGRSAAAPYFGCGLAARDPFLFYSRTCVI